MTHAARTIRALIVFGLIAATATPARASLPSPSRPTPAPWGKQLTGANPVAAAPGARGVLVRFVPSSLRTGRSVLARRSGVAGVSRVSGTPAFLVRAQPGVDPVALAGRLGRSPTVRLAEPNWLLSSDETLPNDPLFGEQWGLRNTGQAHPVADPPPEVHAGTSGADARVAQAWDTTQGSPTTVVAIIDSGVDLTHPDLVGNLWVNTDETPGNLIDDDGNGYVDDTQGWDFYADDGTPEDANGHGTHVAGIVAASADNTEGGAGVCPRCTIMPLRAGSPTGVLTTADVLAAIAYARDNGADIINMSFGAHVWSSFERNAIKAAGQQGILVVAAAGNDARDNDYLYWSKSGPIAPNYPASFNLPNVISVAASTDDDRFGYLTGCYAATGSSQCLFTNWGRTSVDLAAPGVDIESTWLAGDYRLEDGTSMAAPFVSGVAGLVKSQHPSYSPVQIKNAILNSVHHPKRLAGRYIVTDGRVDAAAALTASTKNATPRTDGTMDGAVRIRFKKTGTVSFPGDINDIYRVRLTRGHRYAALLQVPKGADFDLFVWKPGTVDTWPLTYGCHGVSCQLQTGSARGTGADEYVVFRPRTSGTYYLHVTLSAGHGRYTLFVGRPA